jgi:hypothetical protein
VGREIYYRNKCEKITEKVDEIGDEIEVIIEYDCVERGLFGDELIDVFGKVENDDDHDQQRNGIEKGTQEFFNDIVIDRFHWYFSGYYAVKVEKLSEPLG